MKEYGDELKNALRTILIYAAILGLAPLLSWLINGKPWA